MSKQRELPFVLINGAVSADGKLALENRSLIQFSSRRDQQSVFKLRAEADAVLSGAETVETFSIDLSAGAQKWRDLRMRRGLCPEPLRVLVSLDAKINPRAEIFRKRVSPIIILSTRHADKKRIAALCKVADEVKIFGGRTVNFAAAFAWLREKHGVKRIVCEGGGETNAGLFRAGVVDELHLTICPLVLSGRNAPTITDGRGISALKFAPRLKLKSCRRVKDEIFLVYQVL